jgi:hypothetical protein
MSCPYCDPLNAAQYAAHIVKLTLELSGHMDENWNLVRFAQDDSILKANFIFSGRINTLFA